ncbi:hypothetical protein NS234_12310 [Microbacterium oxydans]|uniref:hypothetical protein n=1 Tax=Microbacterium oxydans TaxID=82380 RepID=UPI0007348F94|nr:hypothetical protein [Microbacterium oxydans]KTR76201.1 hypothetical protein NS234_12310 [Microbacterium oxydans]
MEQETPEPEPELNEAAAADDESEERELSLGEAFYVRLASLIGTFAHRQSEVLRMSEYFGEREGEINDAKRRAKRRIEQELEEADEALIDRYLRIFEAYDDLASDTESVDRAEREAAFADALREVGRELPRGAESTYLQAVLRSTNRSVGAGYLHSSLLMILVGELEMFINQVARACFEVRPTALDQGGRTLTWAEIANHDSIDDLRDWVVDRTVEDLLRGSLIDWMKFFENRFQIAEIKVARSFEAAEAVQRRHCFVHNTGMVSQQYLDKLADFPITAELYDELEVDAKYLSDAADTLFLVGYSLVWALGMKLNPEPEWNEHLLSSLTNRTMFLLQEQRYSLVQRIAEAAPLASLKGERGEYCSFVFSVNRWIAYKELGDFEKVRREVENYPVSNRSNNYKLAKAALLDQDEDAHEIAQRMLKDGDLLPSHLLTWPLLRGVREVARRNERGGADASGSTVDETGEDTLMSTPDL